MQEIIYLILPGHTPLWFIRLAFHSICKSVYNTLVHNKSSLWARTSFFQKLFRVIISVFRVNTFRFIDHSDETRIAVLFTKRILKRYIRAYNSHTPTAFVCFFLPSSLSSLLRASLIAIFTRVPVSITSVFIKGNPSLISIAYAQPAARFIIAVYTYNHANNWPLIKMQLYYYTYIYHDHDNRANLIGTFRWLVTRYTANYRSFFNARTQKRRGVRFLNDWLSFLRTNIQPR